MYEHQYTAANVQQTACTKNVLPKTYRTSTVASVPLMRVASTTMAGMFPMSSSTNPKSVGFRTFRERVPAKSIPNIIEESVERREERWVVHLVVSRMVLVQRSIRERDRETKIDKRGRIALLAAPQDAQRMHDLFYPTWNPQRSPSTQVASARRTRASGDLDIAERRKPIRLQLGLEHRQLALN